MKLFYVILIFGSGLVSAQLPSGSELLDKSIAFHDPTNLWDSFKGALHITMKTPDGTERNSEVEINLPAQFFKLTTVKDGITLEQTITKSKCLLLLDGKSEFSEEEAKTHRLTCDRAHTMKDYYTYLYGLPMKLKDPGTVIDTRVRLSTFKGKEYLALKVNYEQAVGSDVWYFYFDPVSYALEAYQFYHDQAKNDGEYILLTGIEAISGIKMPKTRAWYYNKDNAFLGTDVLTKATLE